MPKKKPYDDYPKCPKCKSTRHKRIATPTSNTYKLVCFNCKHEWTNMFQIQRS